VSLIVLIASASAISAAVLSVGNASKIRRQRPVHPADRFLAARVAYLERRG